MSSSTQQFKPTATNFTTRKSLSTEKISALCYTITILKSPKTRLFGTIIFVEAQNDTNVLEDQNNVNLYCVFLTNGKVSMLGI